MVNTVEIIRYDDGEFLLSINGTIHKAVLQNHEVRNVVAFLNAVLEHAPYINIKMTLE